MSIFAHLLKAYTHVLRERQQSRHYTLSELRSLCVNTRSVFDTTLSSNLRNNIPMTRNSNTDVYQRDSPHLRVILGTTDLFQFLQIVSIFKKKKSLL